jgi:hypothetical protein
MRMKIFATFDMAKKVRHHKVRGLNLAVVEDTIMGYKGIKCRHVVGLCYTQGRQWTKCRVKLVGFGSLVEQIVSYLNVSSK